MFNTIIDIEFLNIDINQRKEDEINEEIIVYNL